MRSLLLTFALCGALGAAAGCSSNNGHKPDANVDGLTYDLSLDLPPGCPPAEPNEKGIGSPCTRGGHECTGGLLCACDSFAGLTLNGVPCICTIANLNTQPNNVPCSTQPSNLCGSGATCCNYLKTAYYCSPNVCLPGGECVQFSADGG